MMVNRALADGVLDSMVRAYERNPINQFTVTPSLNTSGAYRLAHPGGRINARPELVEELVQRKMVQVLDERQGYVSLGITIRGFDYHAHHLRAE